MYILNALKRFTATGYSSCGDRYAATILKNVANEITELVIVTTMQFISECIALSYRYICDRC